MKQEICAFCGKTIDGESHAIDIDDAETGEVLCTDCHTNLENEFGGAKGDDNDE